MVRALVNAAVRLEQKEITSLPVFSWAAFLFSLFFSFLWGGYSSHEQNLSWWHLSFSLLPRESVLRLQGVEVAA